MDVKHYLGIYTTRKKMQEDGITTPREEIKLLTKVIVEKLSKLPLDEKINLIENQLIDSKGNVIIVFPRKE